MNNFNVITMPGGEQHVTYKHDSIPKNPCVRVDGIVTADKLIAALMACEVYGRTGRAVDLVLPYFPGARQDRVQDKVSLSAEIYAGVVASSDHIKSITVLDIHSDKAMDILKQSPIKEKDVSLIRIRHDQWFLPWIESTTFAPGPHKFLFPDKGAEDKYSKIATYSPYMACRKRRDPVTGALSGFEVPDLRRFAEDQFLWIVDDICDGGGTFIAIAEEVRKQLGNRCKLGLAVSHGIFSKGTGDLATLFDYIATTDSVYDIDMGTFISVQPLQPILRSFGINA